MRCQLNDGSSVVEESFLVNLSSLVKLIESSSHEDQSCALRESCAQAILTSHLLPWIVTSTKVAKLCSSAHEMTIAALSVRVWLAVITLMEVLSVVIVYWYCCC